MPGRKKLRKVQWGKEAAGALGTPVAATTIWRGPASSLADDRELEEIPEDVGILAGTDRDAIVKLAGSLELPETALTFEQLPYLLAMALGGPTTGTADAGAGASGRIYQTTVPTLSAPTPVAYTIEAGDDFEVEQMEYSLCTKIVIKGAVNKTAKVSAALMGRQVQRKASGFTASVALPVVEEVVMKSKLFMDAINGTYGTTQVSGQVLGYELTIETTWRPNFTVDSGNLFFSHATYVDHTISGTLTYLHDTAVSGNGGAKQFYRDRTPRLLRLQLDGKALATPGTTHTTKKIIIDLPIKFSTFGALEDDDGIDTVAMEFVSRYNATAGNAGSITVVNELAALP